MSSGSISTLEASDRRTATATIVSAFAADPVERWLFPSEEEYERHFPDFIDALGGRSFDQKTAWGLDHLSAVALWLPPGVEPDEDLVVATLSEKVTESKHEEMFSVLEQMAEAHPSYPHWYLPWLAVTSARQSEGLGARLLEHCLEIVDASGLPAFLETPNPRNVGFYERHGFEITAVTRSPSCPPLTSMTRALTTNKKATQP